jgi:hypothetical protein
MTHEEARAHVGDRVRYRPSHGEPEDGEITGINGAYVFVRYDGDRHSKATAARVLELI